MKVFQKSIELYRWEAIRRNEDYQKESSLLGEKYKLTKYSFAFENYQPNPNEDYDSWWYRILYDSSSSPSMEFMPSMEKRLKRLPDKAFYQKWGFPLPIPHTIEYPHPAMLFFSIPSFVKLINLGKNFITLRIDRRGKYEEILMQVKAYLFRYESYEYSEGGLFKRKRKKEKRQRIDHYDQYFHVYDLKKEGKTAKEIAQKLWPKEYGHWERKFGSSPDRDFTEEEEKKIDTFLKKHVREVKPEGETWDSATREYKATRKVNPLVERAHKYYQRAKKFIRDPSSL